MKRGIMTFLAAAAFIAGHVSAMACQASMSIPVPRESKPEHSCCGKHAPSNPKAPLPNSCCCADGVNLAVVDVSAPVADAPEFSAPGGDTFSFIDCTAILVPGGRPPPGPAPGIPLYTLHASLLI